MQCNLLQYDFDIMSHVVISHCYFSKMCQTLANQLELSYKENKHDNGDGDQVTGKKSTCSYFRLVLTFSANIPFICLPCTLPLYFLQSTEF